jgi:hypothetical protein
MVGTRTPLFSRNQPGGMFTIEDVARHPGTIFFVDSNAAGAGDTTGHGASPDSPFATLDYAIGQCTASKGDTIYVLPGHAEAIAAAAGIDADVAGISIIGLGNGTNRPTITLGTLTTATFRINAANVLMRNFRFVGNIDSLVKFINVNESYATIEDCVFVTSSTKEALSFINLATTFDYLTVRRCRFEQPTDPTGTDGNADTGAIFMVDSENVLVEDCWFIGNFETAIFHNRTTAAKQLWVKNCFGIQALSGAEPFQLVAGATGGAFGGQFITPAEAAATEATLVGTLGDGFFISPTTGFGNDGGAGGQGAIVVTTAS